MEYVYLLLLLGVVIALCVFINRVTDKLKIPSLLLFIGLGVLFGVLMRPQIGNFTDYTLGNAVCSVCLVFVIFYGGFGTNFKEAKPVAARSALLSFAGTALTAVLTGVGVYAVFQILPFGKIGWAESMLVGCVLCSTDAASVFNILRTRKLNLRYRTSSLLEMESGSNDPVSYMLTVVFVTVLGARAGVSQAIGGWQIVGMLCAQIGFGALSGILFGILGIAVFLCVAVRLFYMQVINHEFYQQKALALQNEFQEQEKVIEAFLALAEEAGFPFTFREFMEHLYEQAREQ